MIIMKPSFQIETPIDRNAILKRIEKAGRTCYKSEEKITEDSASKFVKSVVDRGHLSVIEHENISVRIICDRGVSHELVRHRIASYSQESSRYCNYHKKEIAFILPCWFTAIKEGQYSEQDIEDLYDNASVPLCEELSWITHMYKCQSLYNEFIRSKWTPEQARSILPNSLKTEIVMTTNLREWKYIFEMRCSEKAHPQMREIMIPLREEFRKALPEIFGEIECK
jgi:thymidylate synthase (FAD)